MPATEAIPITASAGAGAQETASTRIESVDDFSHSLEVFNVSDEMIQQQELQSAGQASAAPISLIDQEQVTNDCKVPMLPGEYMESSMNTGHAFVYLTNYRLIVTIAERNALALVPIAGIEALDINNGNNLYYVQIYCKYGRVYRVQCSSGVQVELHKKLQKVICSIHVGDVFAWNFARAAKKEMPPWLKFDSTTCDVEFSADDEFERLGYNKNFWRISSANNDYKLCGTYPKSVIVPKDITDEELLSIHSARNNARFPTAAWRFSQRDTVLMRSSQPCCGIFNYRFPVDERLLENTRMATNGGQSACRLLIIDCRSYTAVLANRVLKGGGAEFEDFYQQTDIEFMGLANIHDIRGSFSRLRTLLAGPHDQATFLQSLQSTNWLYNMFALMNTAQRCVRALVSEGRSVLVHCTDGWDRTTQIVTLAKIMADPYYRTFEGFKRLIARDWIDFGHKFSERTGLQSLMSSEVSPIFLQWLDCVYQLHERYPDAFQFSLTYLAKLAIHSYSGLFGTFLWNSQSERRSWEKPSDDAETLSLWTYLNDTRPDFINVLYDKSNVRRLTAPLGVADLHVWKQVYVGPQLERSCNVSDQWLSNSGMGISQHSDGDRSSLHRAHSAESIQNVDPSVTQTAHNLNGHAQYHSSNTSSTPAEDKVVVRPTDIVRPSRSQPHIDEIEEDGLIRIADVREDKTRKKVVNLEAKLRAVEKRLKNLESGHQGRTSDFRSESPQRGCRTLTDENSPSCSIESVLSGMSMIDREDASEISEGSKGWLMDTASQQCMACHKPFDIIDRKHHCRNCGRIFCASCSNQSYHRVHDSKGENVRVCSKCYESMLARTQGTPTATNSGTSTPHSHAPSHKPPTDFMIGSNNGQTVCG